MTPTLFLAGVILPAKIFFIQHVHTVLIAIRSKNSNGFGNNCINQVFFILIKIVHGAKHMYSIIRRGLQGTKLGTRPPNNINVVSYIHSQSRFSEQLINDFTKLTGEHILAPHFSCISRCNTALTVTDQYTEGSRTTFPT